MNLGVRWIVLPRNSCAFIGTNFPNDIKGELRNLFFHENPILGAQIV